MRFKAPSVRAVASALRDANSNCEGECDVRLQVYDDGQWALRVGSSDYDQDHRGSWGASSVNGKRFKSERVASDLIEQARTQYFDTHPITVVYLDENRVTSKRQGKAPHNYSRSGYGNKIPTSWMIQLDGKRWHRIYCICYSNSGSAYIFSKGEKLFLGSYDPNYTKGASTHA